MSIRVLERSEEANEIWIGVKLKEGSAEKDRGVDAADITQAGENEDVWLRSEELILVS